MILNPLLLCSAVLINFIQSTVQSPLQGWADRGNGLARRMYLIAKEPLHPRESYANIVATRSFTVSPLVPRQTSSPISIEVPKIHPRELPAVQVSISTTSTLILNGRDPVVAASSTTSPLVLNGRAAKATSTSTSSPLVFDHVAVATSILTLSPIIVGKNADATTSSTTSTLILAQATTSSTTSTLVLARRSLGESVLAYCGWAACSSSSSTSTPFQAIPTKADPKCNVQGDASWAFQQNYLWGSTFARDVLSCQASCMAISQCESYSYQPAVASNDANCIFYTGEFDSEDSFVNPNPHSRLRFSNKYPEDGSNFCYGE